jgi:hypothetical protein
MTRNQFFRHSSRLSDSDSFHPLQSIRITLTCKFDFIHASRLAISSAIGTADVDTTGPARVIAAVVDADDVAVVDADDAPAVQSTPSMIGGASLCDR